MLVSVTMLVSIKHYTNWLYAVTMATSNSDRGDK